MKNIINAKNLFFSFFILSALCFGNNSDLQAVNPQSQQKARRIARDTIGINLSQCCDALPEKERPSCKRSGHRILFRSSASAEEQLNKDILAAYQYYLEPKSNEQAPPYNGCDLTWNGVAEAIQHAGITIEDLQ
jgi:hypothetical protein